MRRRRSGSNAVEFALSLPVIIFILSGVVDFSYYFHLQYNMINAVAQGVRAGVEIDLDANPSPEDVAEAVAGAIWTNAQLHGEPTFVATNGTEAAPDRTLSLTGSMAYEELVGVLPVPQSVAHTATMRMIDQPEAAGGG